jgi:hypothetical protein
MTETDKNSPPQNSSLLIPAHPLLGREENMKLLFDDVMSDISHDRKTSLRLSEQAQLQQARHQTNAGTIDHLINAAIVIALQTGETENDQTVDPIRTSTADAPIAAIGTADAGVAVSAQAVATSLGNLASALVPIITATAGVVTAQSLAALLSTVVASVGQSAGTSTSPTAK